MLVVGPILSGLLESSEGGSTTPGADCSERIVCRHATVPALACSGSSGASGHFHGFLRDLRTFGVVVSFLSELTFGFALLQLLTRLIGVVVGVVAAIRVRKETRSPPEYISSSPYGWWP